MVEYGGLLQYTSQLSNHLSINNEVTVLVPTYVRERYLFNESVKVIPIHGGHNKKNFIINILLPHRILNFLMIVQKESPDIIHFQSTQLWTSLFLPFLRKYKMVTTIHDVTPHTGTKKYHKIVSRNRLAKYSDAIIVHGKKAKEDLMNQNIKKKCHVIPHGDYSFFTNYIQNDIKELNSVLFFGNILDYKGLKYLIKAEPLITEKIPDVKIVIAGEGNFKKYRNLIKNVNKFEIHNQFISDENVPILFQRAKIVVLPYIEGTQSGIIPIAYAFKKPVVATDVGSIPEVVDTGKTGFIVTPRDEKALADAIIRLLKDDKLRKDMGENAYKKMKEELSWGKIAEKTIEVYKEVIMRKQ
jgi:glycosyltransferase involved in cell wall biosynthesis